MFSLIITIISIALVAALALATLYYGGSAFNKGSDGATAARLINEGQQVNGAITILRADTAASGGTSAVADLAGLTTATPAYLTQVPATFDGTDAIPAVGGVLRSADAVTDGVCAEINARAGHATEPASGATPGVYGCDADNSFYFKM